MKPKAVHLVSLAFLAMYLISYLTLGRDEFTTRAFFVMLLASFLAASVVTDLTEHS